MIEDPNKSVADLLREQLAATEAKLRETALQALANEGQLRDALAEVERWRSNADNERERATAAESALAAAEAAMAEHRRANCTHPNATANGWVSSAGAREIDHHCPDCGATWHNSVPPKGGKTSVECSWREVRK